MSPRPRTVNDDAILDATGRVVGRLGFHRLTLADIALECGLSAATLIQRFGSKHKLLLQLAMRDDAGSADAFANAFRPDQGPLDQLIDALTAIVLPFAAPDSAANLICFRLAQSNEPELHDQLVSTLDAELASSIELLDEALADGELSDCDPNAIARALIDVRNGSLMSCALDRQGDVRSRVRATVDAVLEPWRARPRVR
ncbi:MAG TPA: TetR/AcrR family transcriptional regulator [Gemmatimonadaceae bacterium]|nr:TetR/AcrR family transcriptional regulator [Gemmatimonadaceae bacterium]